MTGLMLMPRPATGHGLQYLRMPQAARDTFGTGLVQREANRVVELLQDARTTAIHLVTLGEDMPVTETLEAQAQLAGSLGLPVGAVVVNRLHTRRFDAAVVRRLDDAAAGAGSDGPLLRAVADRATQESSWAAINAHHVARLREGAAVKAALEGVSAVVAGAIIGVAGGLVPTAVPDPMAAALFAAALVALARFGSAAGWVVAAGLGAGVLHLIV
jgi:hypothetical protein